MRAQSAARSRRLTSRCSGPRPRAALSLLFWLAGPWPGPLSFVVRRQETEATLSFDVFVQDLPSDARSVEDIPDDFSPQPIGERARLLAGILRAAPSADFSDPTWGQIVGPDFSIEVSIGSEDVLDSFAFHIRGSQEALFVVADILSELRLRAIAPGTESGFFELGELGEAYSRWRAYRQQVVGRGDDA